MKPLNFSIVVAFDKNLGIGLNGDLPWRLPEDLKHFKKITTCAPEGKKNVVVMGRKTWESLPERFRPLPDRINIVLTRNKDFELPKGVFRATSLDQILDVLKQSKFLDVFGEIFIIGGQQIFEETFKSGLCQKIYATHILNVFNCDTFFPKFEHLFSAQNSTEVLTSQEIPYYFCEYLKS